MADPNLVPLPAAACIRNTARTSKEKNTAATAVSARSTTSPGTKTTTNGLLLVRTKLTNMGVSLRSQEIIETSWRNSTTKQYNVYLLKWIDFAKTHSINVISPTIAQVLNFLTHLFDSGLGYSALNTAMSALSSTVTLHKEPHLVGEHPLVQRFMKAVFQSRPSLPRYSETWDVKKVLDFLKTIEPAPKLTLKDLTLKLVTLILLITGARCQTVQLMDIDNLTFSESLIKCHIANLVKQSAPGRPQPTLVIPAYPMDERLCVFTYFKEYLDRTRSIRNSNSLFISYCKPHKAAICTTIARWTRVLLTKAGINTAIFKAHSVRSASTSAAKSANLVLG